MHQRQKKSKNNKNRRPKRIDSGEGEYEEIGCITVKTFNKDGEPQEISGFIPPSFVITYNNIHLG